MVRIWCLPVSILDRQHLLGEHREGHSIMTSITRDRLLTEKFPTFYKFLHLNKIRIGWLNHPETCRFKEHLGMLVDRHKQQVEEMSHRGYKHKSPLPEFEFVLEDYTYSDKDRQRDLQVLASRNGLQNPCILCVNGDNPDWKVCVGCQDYLDWRKNLIVDTTIEIVR